MNRREFIQRASATSALLAAGRANSRESFNVQRLTRRLAEDPHRPRYHFLPPAHWMNDPNGPIFWNGRYHMFYQHNPNGAFWGTMHWGHAESRDLVHWKHLPIALAPTPGGPDKNGVFTGCAVVHKGVPTLVYTGVSPEVQCLATSDDEMIVWKKYAGNPVVAAPPKGLEVVGFRDPCVWWEADLWHVVIGSGFKGVGGAALLYTSENLIQWKYQHPLFVGKTDSGTKSDDPVASGEMWECPDFFPLGGKHVLIVSTEGTARYFIGTFAQRKFHPEREGQIDFGAYYAPKSMLDANGRRILWGWIQERRSDQAQRLAGWSGVLSLPRVLTLGSQGRLEITPAAELEVLREKPALVQNLRVTTEDAAQLREASGDSLEIAAEFEAGDAEEFGLRVRCSPDGSEQTLISYDTQARRLKLDRTQSSLSEEVDRGVTEGPLELASDGRLKLRIFLDGSVIEVLANGRAWLTDRIYPARPDSLGLGIFTRGGTARLISMDVWRMQAISRNRLTA